MRPQYKGFMLNLVRHDLSSICTHVYVILYVCDQDRQGVFLQLKNIPMSLCEGFSAAYGLSGPFTPC